MTLLSRNEFRARVFARDMHHCVVCRAPAQDAHHIMERRLFEDGGYYLDNGASLCGEDHIHAESTALSCEEIRLAARITKIVLPPHLYDDEQYDKWGNPIFPNGQRIRGELFYDESVQKALAPVLYLFTSRVKYPRTYHLPFSPGVMNDDRVMPDTRYLECSDVVVTVKMDGEQTTMYNDYIHARSIDYVHHPSRSRVRALHGKIAHEIPPLWRVCGENLYAKHSIYYKNLTDYFQLFTIWNENAVCLSWDETKEWANLLGLNMVESIYEGRWNEGVIRNLYKPEFHEDPCEGFVVRVRDRFSHAEHKKAVGKYVRAQHVQAHAHWIREKLVPNEVK